MYASVHRSQRRELDGVDLLAEVLRGLPRFRHVPMCAGMPKLWDGEDDTLATAAEAMCAVCPALRDCAAWAATEPENSLSGVVAGKRYRPTLKRLMRARTAASA